MARKRKYKLNKKKVVRTTIIFAIIGSIIIYFNIIKIKNNFSKNKQQKDIAVLTAPSNEDNFEKIMNKFEIKLNSKIVQEDYSIKMEVKFKYNLYEEETSKEDYFLDLIYELNKFFKDTNYYLKDKDKGIDIKSIYNYQTKEYNFTINGIEDYFSNEENIKKINSYMVIDAKEEKISKEEIFSLEVYEWNILNAPLNNFTKDKSGNITTQENMHLEISRGKIIKRLVLNKDYKENIIKNIKVGTSQEEIKKQLGDPTFENTKMIGYKLENEYVFFYEDKIVLYPNIKYSDNDTLEELIQKYYNGEYTKGRSRFANEILRTYSDFDSRIEDDVVILSSITRQIELKLDNNGEIEIFIYNNYNLGTKLKNMGLTGNVNLKLDEDYVYVYENNN